MKYKLLKPLGPWKAGTIATREWWNDEGLPPQLLDDPNWFERVDGRPKVEAVERATNGWIVIRISGLEELPGKTAIEAALNGDAPQGWTVDQMKSLTSQFVDQYCNEPADENVLTHFLNHLETLTPEKPKGITFTRDEVLARIQAFGEWYMEYQWPNTPIGDEIQRWLSGAGPEGDAPQPDPENPRTYSEAEVLAFGAECITASYTKPAGYTNEHHLREVFSEWSGQEPAEVKPVDPKALRYSWEDMLEWGVHVGKHYHDNSPVPDVNEGIRQLFHHWGFDREPAEVFTREDVYEWSRHLMYKVQPDPNRQIMYFDSEFYSWLESRKK